jgi:methionyl-tRNA formyltransferase
MKEKYRIIYCGTWGYGRAGFVGLLALENVEIVKVLTKWDPGTHDKYLNQIYEIIKDTDIPHVNCRKDLLSAEEFNNEIYNCEQVDFIFSCCFDRIFSNDIIRFPKIGSMNIHPSILPRYRGIKPLENAIVHEESYTGITLHQITREIDAGDIILQKKIPINKSQTFKQLYNLQCDAIKEILNEFFHNPGELISLKQSQDESLASVAPRLKIRIQDDDTVSEIVKKYKAFILSNNNEIINKL